MKRLFGQTALGAMLVWMITGLSACESPTCPSAVPDCPACPACDQNNVTLSSLDNASRERLKTEIMAEIKNDLIEQWKTEWLAKQPVPEIDPTPVLPNSDETPNEPDADDEKPVRRSHASTRPPLPPTQPVEKDERGLKVMRQVLSTEISRRLPVDEREQFSIEDASVFCYVEISSNSEIERAITVKFTHSTGLTQSYELPVGQSPAWRTWSKLNLTSSMTGAWLCEIFNEEGVLLASKPFTVSDTTP